jgi:hypothetical protein
MPETVAAIHRVLTHGSSFPSVVETTTGRQLVLKLSGAGPGGGALAMEFVALMLAGDLGLHVPKAELLDLPRDLPWQAGTDEFYEALQRSAGPNLGIAFIADAENVTATQLASLPGDFLDTLAAIDALLQNVDRTRSNPNILRDRCGTPWAIDFGACLLFDRLARGAPVPRLDLPQNHLLADNDTYIGAARQAALCIETKHIRAAVERVPEAWLADWGIARHELQRRCLAYVDAVRAMP